MAIEVRRGSIEDFEEDLALDRKVIEHDLIRIEWRSTPVKGFEPLAHLKVHAGAVVRGSVVRFAQVVGTALPQTDSKRKAVISAQETTDGLKAFASRQGLEVRRGAFHIVEPISGDVG